MLKNIIKYGELKDEKNFSKNCKKIFGKKIKRN
jgi:hypothetical protein